MQIEAIPKIPRNPTIFFAVRKVQGMAIARAVGVGYRFDFPGVQIEPLQPRHRNLSLDVGE